MEDFIQRKCLLFPPPFHLSDVGCPSSVTFVATSKRPPLDIRHRPSLCVARTPINQTFRSIQSFYKHQEQVKGHLAASDFSNDLRRRLSRYLVV